MERITPAMKVGIVTRRYPETVDVFEWHDIDTNDRRHATLDEIANELELEIETLLDEVNQALLDYPDDESGDEDEEDELAEITEEDIPAADIPDDQAAPGGPANAADVALEQAG